MTDGAPPGGFHIRNGPHLRDRQTKRAIMSSYTDEWRPAWDVLADGSHEARKLTSYYLAAHVRGSSSVAVGDLRGCDGRASAAWDRRVAHELLGGQSLKTFHVLV